MNVFPMLLKREYWEHNGSFARAPLIIGGVIFLFAVLALTFTGEIDGERLILREGIKQFAAFSPEQLNNIYQAFLVGSTVVFNISLFFVILFYLLGALHDDRKDRSFLFWKSLPVSDTLTVLSKVVTAVVIAPLITFVAVTICHLLFFIGATFLLWYAGESAWDVLWSPAPLISTWLHLAFAYIVQGLWLLPIYGWLLLASAFTKANGRPFLWAVLPIVGWGALTSLYAATAKLQLDLSIWKVIGERIAGGVLPISINDDESMGGTIKITDDGLEASAFSFESTMNTLLSADMVYGVAIAAGLIFLTIWMRRFRDDA